MRDSSRHRAADRMWAYSSIPSLTSSIDGALRSLNRDLSVFRYTVAAMGVEEGKAAGGSSLMYWYVIRSFS